MPKSSDTSADTNEESIPCLDHDSFRDTYPGWIIAPATVRNSLASVPVSWRIDAIKKTQDLAPVVRLEALDNFNWWLQLALEPLWEPVAAEIKKVLDEINPFPTLLKDWPGSVVSEDECKVVNEITQTRWLALSLAYLRFLREERKLAEFELWARTLHEVTADFPQYRQRLYFERGLFALDNCDDAKAEAILAEWTHHECDPMWSVRRAALLTELGRISEAYTLVSQALIDLRRFAPNKHDIPSQSREGWCMKLLYLLHQVNHNFDESVYAQFNERWEELNEFRCNPFVDWNYFEAVLTANAHFGQSRLARQRELW